MSDRYRLHGLKLSYFTGKLEAYLHVKGVPFDFVDMDMADFERCAAATGVRQMPQLESPDGRWLTDTTHIIAAFEAEGDGPSLSPAAPLSRYASRFLEDVFDEWLWRPALYYRWAFEEDRELMGAQIARTMLRDAPGPLWARKRFIIARQRRVYMTHDGVTKRTAPQIEALYLKTLDLLEPIFAARPYLFGERPCEADFGLFGPMFRHFASDPTPAGIMRERAPRVLAWTARLWAARPAEIDAAPELTTIPEDLGPLFSNLGADYLSYLAANRAAIGNGASHTSYAVGGVEWRVPASPYRDHCLSELQRGYAALCDDDKTAVARLVGAPAGLLAKPSPRRADAPAPAAHRSRPLDRTWRPV